MMTNGVVHANVFGIKDWVTPYKISVLALLYEMTTSKPIALQERRRLNKLILPLQQVGIAIDHLTTSTFHCQLLAFLYQMFVCLSGSRLDS